MRRTSSKAPARRDVAVNEIVRRGLIGDHIRDNAACEQRLIHVGRVAKNADRRSPALTLRRFDHRQSVVEIAGAVIEVTVRQALGDALVVDLHAENDRAGHAARERLRTAHAAKPRRQDEAAGEAVIEVALGDADENFVGALNHALRADVLPIAGREPAPADQVPLLQLVKVLRLGPLPDHVAIGHDHDRRLVVSFQETDRLAGLHDQRLILRHRHQRFDDLVVGRPVARGFAQRRIDDEIGWILANREHVFQEPQQAFLPPAATAQVRSRCDGKAFAHRGSSQSITRNRNAESRFAHRIDGGVFHRRTQRQVRLLDMEHRKLNAFLDMPDADRPSVGTQRRDHIRKCRQT